MPFTQFIDSYLVDAEEGFEAINRALLTLEGEPGRKDQIDPMFRAFHTMKSASRMLEFGDVADLAHAAEDLLQRLRDSAAPVSPASIALLFEVADTLHAMVRQRAGTATGAPQDFGPRVADLMPRMAAHDIAAPPAGPAAPGQAKMPPSLAIERIGTIRVPAEVLDTLFNQIGELTLIKNRIGDITAGSESKELHIVLAAMRRLTGSMQETISLARLVRVGEILKRFPRMVRDLALADGKEVDLALEGEDTEIDKGVLDALGEPLLHLVRNAVDHGIEPPDERRRAGKPPRGRIRIAARRTESHILIEVDDDGGGIDLARVRETAVQKGLIASGDGPPLPDKDIVTMLFDLGVSTADRVTGLSGRGVGLRIVKARARELGGSVQVVTQPGRGTRFTLQLPVTTAIMQMLMVGVGDHIFGIPSDIVIETMRLRRDDIRRISSDTVLMRRNEAIPFTWLDEKLGVSAGTRDEEAQTVVIVRRGDTTIGLGVNAVISQMENIVKPFDPFTRHCRGFSGGTVLGDGRVALLLDIPTLFGFESLAGISE